MIMPILRKSFVIVFIFILLFLSANIYGQTFLECSQAKYKEAVDLYEKEMYAWAQEMFHELIAEKNLPETVLSDAEYFAAYCAVELFHKDAEYLVSKFIENNPESNKIKNSYFLMGRHLYRNKRFAKAIKWFEKVDKYEIDPEQLDEYFFKTAYSYFVMNDFENAQKFFYEVKDLDSEYAPPAIYFYAHIQYMNENYETALKSFSVLDTNPNFAPIIPYYLTQIYYFQEKYDKVKDYAPDLLENATTKRAPEIARIVGEAYYRSNEFAEAVPYLEQFKQATMYFSREDLYQLGIAYFKSRDYKNAAKNFNKVAITEDTLGQNATYHLASCYLNAGDKRAAMLAFQSVSKMKFNPALQEDALYNFAKLTFELSYSPFNEAIKAINKYIETYPKSARIDEAYGYLVKAYMTTKNYEDALSSLEKIKEQSPEIEEAYQKIAYYRGLEHFNNLNFREAKDFFKKSLYYSKYNDDIKSRSYYWSGEANYRLKKYRAAIDDYKRYLVSPGSVGDTLRNVVDYNIAYCYFKLKDYDESNIWFRKYVDKESKANYKTDRYGDAYLRVGDSYFIERNFLDAAQFYGRAIEVKTADVDYAMIQIALSMGLLKRFDEKINVLTQLVSSYPASTYLDDAVYELGKTHLKKNNNDKAIEYLTKLITEFPNSSYKKAAFLRLGLVYYNTDKYNEALTAYKQLIAEFPNSSETKNALTGIRNVYVHENNIGAYEEYAKSLGDIAVVSDNEIDSLTYIAAENYYMDGVCEEAAPGFKKYLMKFPEGDFALNAHFYKADCNLRATMYEEALESYTYVANAPQNMFTESALLKKAGIEFTIEKYNDAYDSYLQLEKTAEVKDNIKIARIGQMRSAYLLADNKKAIDAANKLLITDKVSDELIREANYILAKAYYDENILNKALEKNVILSEDVKSKEGAEAKYRVAEILYKQEDYMKAEEEIYDFVEKNTSHQYWLAKSFLLLADILVHYGDDFQAKHTLQSIIANYKGDNKDIIKIADEKLLEILEREEADNQLDDIIDYEIQFNDDSGESESLFNQSGSEESEDINEDYILYDLLQDVPESKESEENVKKEDVPQKEEVEIETPQKENVIEENKKEEKPKSETEEVEEEQGEQE